MDITTSSFINTIFPPHLVDPGERVCLTLADRDGGFGNYVATERRLARFQPGSGAWYFCVSTVGPPTAEGYLSRGKDHLVAAWCLVLDDVGTKAQTPPVAPSWVLESSAGNYQWGYMIDPLTLTPAAMLHYDSCVRGLAQAGYSDPGAAGAYRVMRVPGSLHRTGFISRVTEWHPERVWELDALMAQLGVTPQRTRGGKKYVREAMPGGVDVLAACDDHIYHWLRDNGHVLSANQQWVHIICPWRSQHTNGDQGASSTSYSPFNYGSPGRAFKCLHGHCAERRLQDLMRHVNTAILNNKETTE